MALPSPRLLLVLFLGFRLAALALYRPGGLLWEGVAYPALPDWGNLSPLARQWVWGLSLLPLEAVSLWLLLQVARRSMDEAEARWRALLWAVSPLPLWTWLTGLVPFVVAVLLALFWLFRLGRRPWLWVALPLSLVTVTEPVRADLAVLMLPAILLLVPRPVVPMSLFSLAGLVAGPARVALGVTGMAATVLQLGYALALAPSLAEWLLMVYPSLVWDRWRYRARALLVAVAVGVLAFALWGLVPQETRPARREASILAPVLVELDSAPVGWFLTDRVDLWEQAAGLTDGSLEARVVSARNLARLRAALLAAPTQLWLAQSSRPEMAEALEPLVVGFFPAEESPLPDGARMRRFVTGLDAPLVPFETSFADGVVLAGARWSSVVQCGGLVAVELHWRGPAFAESLFIHLLARDTLIAQWDGARGTLPGRHALLVPFESSPGPYRLVVGRYDPGSGQRVPLSQGGDMLLLGEVEVR